MRRQLGLDRPLLEQYAAYLGGLAVGDLGESISYRKPVTRLIAERFPATIELAAAGAKVYCTGRSTRGAPATPGRPETI
jgi:peptide/nickel transport system permease protein